MQGPTLVSSLAPAGLELRPAPGPAAALKDLFKGQATETFAAGDALFFEGDGAGHVFDLVEGVLRLYRILPDGRRAIVGFLFAGDLLGTSLQKRALFTAEAVTPLKVRRLARGRFMGEVNERPTLRAQLFALLCEDMSAAQDQMLLLARKNAQERVASFLLAVHRKAPAEGAIELPMSRIDMADYLGLTMETVSRTMTQLAKRGLIAAAGRHALHLRKLPQLRALAGEDQATAPPAQPRRAVWPN